MSEHPFDTLVNKLIDEKGLSNLDEEALVGVRADLSTRLERAIDAAFLEALPAERLPEFMILLDKDDSDAVQQFLQSHIANYDEVVALAVVQFRKVYLGL